MNTEADTKPTEPAPVLSVTVPLPDLASTIRARLAYLGKSAAWLSVQVGMSPTSLSHRMTGRIPWTLSDVHAAAEALGITARDLIPAATFATVLPEPARA